MVELIGQTAPNGSMNIIVPAGFVVLLAGQIASAWFARPKIDDASKDYMRDGRAAMDRIKGLTDHARREESAMGDAFKDFRAVADRITTEIVKLRTETHDLRSDIRELLVYLKRTNGRS